MLFYDYNYIKYRQFNNLMDTFQKIRTFSLGMSHVVAFLIVSFLTIESIPLLQNASSYDRGLELIELSGFVLEILGFIVLLNPRFIRLLTQKHQEMNFNYFGIIYVLVGLTIQAVMTYYL